MINHKLVKSYCKEPLENIKGYYDAIVDTTNMWECHHILEIQGDLVVSKNTLIQKGLYYQRPASELVFLTKKEHRFLHNTSDNSKYVKSAESLVNFYKTIEGLNKRKRLSIYGRKRKHTKETIQKIKEAHIGKTVTMESRQKMSHAHKGKCGFWTGKTMSQELRMHLRDIKLLMSSYYQTYKQNGGTLLWKQWQVFEWPKIKSGLPKREITGK